MMRAARWRKGLLHTQTDKKLLECAGSILLALIAMKDQTRSGHTLTICQLEGDGDQLRAVLERDFVRDCFARKQIENRAYIVHPPVQTEVRYIAYPNLVWRFN